MVVYVHIGLLGEDAGEGARGVFAEAFGEFGAASTHVEEGVIEVIDGGRGGLMGQWVGGDAGASICIYKSLI